MKPLWFSLWFSLWSSLWSFVALLALAGCAPLQPVAKVQPATPPATSEIIRFTIPPDALGAHDPQLSAVLAKAGALAAAQKQPTTILVTALAQDFPYLNAAIWKGVPPQHDAHLSLDNLTAGANQPYSVTIRPTE